MSARFQVTKNTKDPERQSRNRNRDKRMESWFGEQDFQGEW